MSEDFIPGRYPYTYAADYLRNNPHVVPRDVWERAEEVERDREGRGFESLLSRAQASRIRTMWAESVGRENEGMASEHADAYLIGHGIPPPVRSTVAVEAAAPFVDRAARIDELTSLLNLLDPRLFGPDVDAVKRAVARRITELKDRR